MSLKNYSYRLLFLLVFLGLILYPKGSASAINKDSIFSRETLEYSIKWQNFVGAGHSTLSIVNIGGTYHIEATTTSAEWLKYLGIRVKDVVQARSNLELTKSYNYSANLQEGRYIKSKITRYDHELKKVSYQEDDKTPLEFDLKPYAIDILSAIYAVRAQEFKVGESIKTSVFDEKKFYDVETLILAHELVDIEGRMVGAYKTKVILQTKGIFDRRGDIYIWFSDDERKVPIIIKSKVSLGSFYVTISNPQLLEPAEQTAGN
ncbi:MAG: DUF3108 domain-containing protein [Nitrospinota bacterium]|nr:DUF3108 domain-containing protein [Nitrospinota bacterium]